MKVEIKMQFIKKENKRKSSFHLFNNLPFRLYRHSKINLKSL